MFGTAEEQDDGTSDPLPFPCATQPEIANMRQKTAHTTESCIAESRSRYGEGQRLSVPAIIITAAFHIAAFASALLVGYEVVAKKEEPRLTVVDLTPPPPPPADPTPPPPRPDIVAPIPPLSIARNPPPVATTPDPPPEQPSPVPAASSAPPASVPVVATPSIVQDSNLAAKMVSGAPPRYPIESRRKREQGTVLLSVTVGVDGKVSGISVSQSSGFSRLDDAALSAVRKWRWTPIIRDGRPVMVKGIVEIPFVLLT